MGQDVSSTFSNFRDFSFEEDSFSEQKGQRSNSNLREWKGQSASVSEHLNPSLENWNSIDLSAPVTPRQITKALKPSAASQKAEVVTLHQGVVSSSNSSVIPWAVQLAHDERRMDREGSVDYHNSYRKHELLKSKTSEFMVELQSRMREAAELFNQSRHSAGYHIHIYKVARTEYDFMLYRNSVKLVVSAQQAGKIYFAFNQYLGELFAPGRKPVFEIQASWGALDQLYWSYRSERLDKEDVVRFFFSEFVQQSYR